MTKYYLFNTQNGTCTGGYVYDLNQNFPTGPADVQGSTNSGSYVEILAFDVAVGATGAVGTYNISVEISAVNRVAGARWRLQRVNSSCVVQESSGYSAEYTTIGIKTDAIAFSPSWASGDILRLSIEALILLGLQLME